MSSDDDNIHDHRVELLTRAATSIDVASLDADRLVATARSRRRRRRATGLAGLAAAAVVVGVTALGGTANGPAPDPTPEASVPTTTDPAMLPAPPPGWTWVGMNGVVVTVPEDWPVSESPCGTGAPAEVVDGSLARTATCVRLGGMSARVVFTPLQADPYAGGGPPQGCTDARERGGSAGCWGTAVFTEEQVGVSVTSGVSWIHPVAGLPRTRAKARALRDRILDSARVLPDGWTTVPFAGGLTVEERVELLEAEGFEVEVTDPERIGRYELTVTPGVGSVVAEGSLVRLAPPSPQDG